MNFKIEDGKVNFSTIPNMIITVDTLLNMEKAVMRYGETVAGFNANQIRKLAEDLAKIANNPVYVKKW